MSIRARVLRGEDQGDYRRETTDYGSTFWKRTDRPHQCPVTDGTFQRWLKAGKAVILDDTPAPDPVAPPAFHVAPDLDEPPPDLNLEMMDVAERNWVSEVLTWSREQRVAVLNLCGVKVEPIWSKNQLADELLKVHRRKRGTPKKRPTMPRERPKAAKVSTPAPAPVRPATDPRGWPASVISAPGVQFPGEARAEDFYPLVDSNKNNIPWS